jgi:hypothetical protein
MQPFRSEVVKENTLSVLSVITPPPHQHIVFRGTCVKIERLSAFGASRLAASSTVSAGRCKARNSYTPLPADAAGLFLENIC